MNRSRFVLTSTALLACAAQLAAQDASPAPGPSAAGGATDGGVSAGYTLQVVHVNRPGHPTNVVPGLGVPFRAGGGDTAAFERPTTSANGQHLAINVVAASAVTTDDDVLLLDGAVLLREGSPAPWTASENVGTIDPDFAINDAGAVLLGNNTSATSLDDYIAYFDGTTWSVLAQEGGATPAGGTWSSTIDSTALTNAGVAFYRGTAIAGLPTASNALVVTGATVRQKGVDIPLNQAGGATNTWETFSAERLLTSPDGLVTAIVGDTNAATSTDVVLTINDAVVIQEGVVLPNSTFATGVSAIGKAWIDRAGNWYARGSNTSTNDDWVVRNGVVVAIADLTTEIVPGSGEVWDDTTFGNCFFAFDGNSLGHFVIGGVTSAPTTSNGVIVFDDGAGFRRVLVREGDPVDLDGNGLFDDDRFWNTFGNDDVLLLDDGTLVFVATLRDGTGTAVDQGLFKLLPEQASCTLRNGTGVNPVACTCATLPILGTTWNIAVSSGPQTFATFVFASDSAFGPAPLFGGELLIGPSVFEIAPSIPLPAAPQFLGAQFAIQGLRLDWTGTEFVLVLTNAQDVVVGA
jgi:hypothetical protein